MPNLWVSTGAGETRRSVFFSPIPSVLEAAGADPESGTRRQCRHLDQTGRVDYLQPKLARPSHSVRMPTAVPQNPAWIPIGNRSTPAVTGTGSGEKTPTRQTRGSGQGGPGPAEGGQGRPELDRDVHRRRERYLRHRVGVAVGGWARGRGPRAQRTEATGDAIVKGQAVARKPGKGHGHSTSTTDPRGG